MRKVLLIGVLLFYILAGLSAHNYERSDFFSRRSITPEGVLTDHNDPKPYLDLKDMYNSVGPNGETYLSNDQLNEPISNYEQTVTDCFIHFLGYTLNPSSTSSMLYYDFYFQIGYDVQGITITSSTVTLIGTHNYNSNGILSGTFSITPQQMAEFEKGNFKICFDISFKTLSGRTCNFVECIFPVPANGSIKLEKPYFNCFVKDCKLLLEFNYTLVNTSLTNPAEIQQVLTSGNANTLNIYPDIPFILNADSSKEITVLVEYQEGMNSITFDNIVYQDGYPFIVSHTFDLNGAITEKCIKKDCKAYMANLELSYQSTDNMLYFDFIIQHDIARFSVELISLLDVVTILPGYTYNQADGTITGRFSISQQDYQILLKEGKEVCFKLISCNKDRDEICETEFCFKLPESSSPCDIKLFMKNAYCYVKECKLWINIEYIAYNYSSTYDATLLEVNSSVSNTIYVSPQLPINIPANSERAFVISFESSGDDGDLAYLNFVFEQGKEKCFSNEEINIAQILKDNNCLMRDCKLGLNSIEQNPNSTSSLFIYDFVLQHEPNRLNVELWGENVTLDPNYTYNQQTGTITGRFTISPEELILINGEVCFRVRSCNKDMNEICESRACFKIPDNGCDVSVKPGKIECYVKECKLFVRIEYLISNNSLTTSATLNNVSSPSLQELTIYPYLPHTISPNTTESLYVTFEHHLLTDENATFFFLFDQGGETCKLDNTISIASIIKDLGCISYGCSLTYVSHTLTSGPNPNLIYYSFVLMHDTDRENPELMSSQVNIENFNYDQVSGLVTGVFSLTQQQQQNYINNNTNICFTIRTCYKDVICQASTCFTLDTGRCEVKISMIDSECYIKECKLNVRFSYDIYNYGAVPATITSIYSSNINPLTLNPNPNITVNPNTHQTVYITFEYPQGSPNSTEFTFNYVQGGSKCYEKINVNVSNIVERLSCINRTCDLSVTSLTLNTLLTDENRYYFDFELLHEPYHENIEVTSNAILEFPPVYYPQSGIITGICSISAEEYETLLNYGGSICFNVRSCSNDQICDVKACYEIIKPACDYSIKHTDFKCYVKDCKLFVDLVFEVNNNSASLPATIVGISSNQISPIDIDPPLSYTINPGNSENIRLSFEWQYSMEQYPDFLFTILQGGEKCDTSINIELIRLLKDNGCIDNRCDLEINYFTYNPSMDDGTFLYFDFELMHNPGRDNVVLYTTLGYPVGGDGYDYDPVTGLITGVFFIPAIDYYELIGRDEEICFVVYSCTENQDLICIAKACTPVPPIKCEIKVEDPKFECYVKNCKLNISLTYNIINHSSSTPATLSSITSADNIQFTTYPGLPFTIAPNSQEIVIVTFEYNNSIPDVITFLLSLSQGSPGCVFDITTNIAGLIKDNSCIKYKCGLDYISHTQIPYSTDPDILYFNFELQHVPWMTIMEFTSNEVNIVEPVNYTPASGIISGTFYINRQYYEYLLNNGYQICFDLLSCDHKADVICKDNVCIPLSQPPICDIKVKVEKETCYVKDCQLYVDITFTVYNNSNVYSASFDGISSYDISSYSINPPLSQTILPNSNSTFTLSFPYNLGNTDPASIHLLINQGFHCCDIPIFLNVHEILKENNCINYNCDLYITSLELNEELSNSEISYYNFELLHSPNMSNVEVYSNYGNIIPSTVVYTASNGIITGIISITPEEYEYIVNFNEGELCFKVLSCFYNQEICYATACIEIPALKCNYIVKEVKTNCYGRNCLMSVELIYEIFNLSTTSSLTVIGANTTNDVGFLFVTPQIPFVVNPGGSRTVTVRFPYTSSTADYTQLIFSISQNNSVCRDTMDVDIATIMDNCISHDCKLSLISNNISWTSTSDMLVFNFTLQHETGRTNVNLSSDQVEIENYGYSPLTGQITGTYRISYEDFENLANTNGEICFKVRSCYKNEICEVETCFKVDIRKCLLSLKEVGTNCYISKCRLFIEITYQIVHPFIPVGGFSAALLTHLSSDEIPYIYTNPGLPYYTSTLNTNNTITIRFEYPAGGLDYAEFDFTFINGNKLCKLTTDINPDEIASQCLIASIKCQLSIRSVNVVPPDIFGPIPTYVFFDFSLQHNTNMTNVELSCEPGNIVNYTYNSATGIIDGRLRIHASDLLQILRKGGEICFNVKSCYNNRICNTKTCFNPRECTISTGKEKVKCFVKNCTLYYELSFVVNNNGTTPITLNTVSSSDINISVASPSLPTVIPAGSYKIISITFPYYSTAVNSINIHLLFEECMYAYQLPASVIETIHSQINDCVTNNCKIILKEVDEVYRDSEKVYLKAKIELDENCSDLQVSSDDVTIDDYSLFYEPKTGLLEFGYHLPIAEYENIIIGQRLICFTVIRCVNGVICKTIVCYRPPVLKVPSEILLPDAEGTAKESTELEENEDLNKLKGIRSFIIYPNPATDMCYIEGDDNEITEIELVDMNGRIIDKYNEPYFSVSNLRPGKYIVIIHTKDNQPQSLEFIKQ